MNADMIFIFFLALILFGPKKLPEIGRQIGKFMAEFRRASNDFTTQLQSEIENAGVDVGKISGQVSSPGAQFTQQSASSFAQTLLPPAVKSAISDIDTAHERLMQTARLAFDAQNFTLRPPAAPVVASPAPEATAAEAAPNPAETSAELSAAAPASHDSSPVEAVTDHPTPDVAPAKFDSVPQSS